MSLVENPEKTRENLAALGRNRQRLLCLLRDQHGLHEEKEGQAARGGRLKPTTGAATHQCAYQNQEGSADTKRC
jgi:hypothetical protein